MIPAPNKILISASILSLTATVSGLLFAGWSVFFGLLLSSSFLLANLFLWKIVIQRLIHQSAYGEAPQLTAFFFILKLIILGIGLIVISLLFSPAYVLIANTIIVVALLGVSFNGILQGR
jgi:hypothetical protein